MDKAIRDDVITSMRTIDDMIRWAVTEMNQADIFFGHGTDNAVDEALSLVVFALHLNYTQLDMFRTATLTRAERELIADLVNQRIVQRVPAAYLTNQAWFAGLPFFVNQDVLVPRSPFAELIEKGFRPYLQTEPNMILDLCTGSGCIAIAAAYKFPHAHVDAIDISSEALQVAEINIEQHGLSDRVFPILSDGFTAISGHRYDLIISNPPYVDAEDMASLPEEFLREPELGLASGEDGLELTRHILAMAEQHLNENGWLLVEIGNSMVHVEQAFPGVPFSWVELEQGGHGIFAFSKIELAKYSKQLIQDSK